MNIRKKFLDTREAHPEWSSLVCYNKVITDYKIKLSRTVINKWFKLVLKGDYQGIKKSVLIDYLHNYNIQMVLNG